MLDFFNNSKVIYEIHPQFSNLIDEICIEQSRKNIPLFEELVIYLIIHRLRKTKEIDQKQ